MLQVKISLTKGNRFGTDGLTAEEKFYRSIPHRDGVPLGAVKVCGRNPNHRQSIRGSNFRHRSTHDTVLGVRALQLSSRTATGALHLVTRRPMHQRRLVKKVWVGEPSSDWRTGLHGRCLIADLTTRPESGNSAPLRSTYPYSFFRERRSFQGPERQSLSWII